MNCRQIELQAAGHPRAKQCRIMQCGWKARLRKSARCKAGMRQACSGHALGTSRLTLDVHQVRWACARYAAHVPGTLRVRWDCARYFRYAPGMRNVYRMRVPSLSSTAERSNGKRSPHTPAAQYVYTYTYVCTHVHIWGLSNIPSPRNGSTAALSLILSRAFAPLIL